MKHYRGPLPRQHAVEVLGVHGVSCRFCTHVLCCYMLYPERCPDRPWHCKRCGNIRRMWYLLLEAANAGHVPNIKRATGSLPPFTIGAQYVFDDARSRRGAR